MLFLNFSSLYFLEIFIASYDTNTFRDIFSSRNINVFIRKGGRPNTGDRYEKQVVKVDQKLLYTGKLDKVYSDAEVLRDYWPREPIGHIFDDSRRVDHNDGG